MCNKESYKVAEVMYLGLSLDSIGHCMIRKQATARSATSSRLFEAPITHIVVVRL